MPLVKKYWKDLRFITGNNPILKCPTCTVGHLDGIKGTFHKANTADTTARIKAPEPVSEWEVDFKFSVLLQCSNKKCLEVVSCAGTGYYDQEDDLDEQGWPTFYKYYKPEYFSIPLNIIELHDKFPKSIKKDLVNAFRIFFCDPEGCANKIRIVIES